MKIIFFDLCAIPNFLLILITFFRRRLARYPAYRMFFFLTFLSLLCSILNISMEFIVNPTPLSQAEVVLGMLISFCYKWLRNGSMVIYLLFIFSITRTEHRFRKMTARLILWAPNAVLVFLLIQNFFTGNVFTVTAEGGYARGPLLMVFYLVTALYAIAGVAFCLSCRRFLSTSKLLLLLSVFLLLAVAITIQMLLPNYMVEMYFTSIGLLMLMLLVVRPEEAIDSSVGCGSWQSFQNDLHVMLYTRSRLRISVLHLPNAHEIRNYLGDQQYFAFIRQILDSMQAYTESLHVNGMFYFEHPGNIYLIMDEDEPDLEIITKECLMAAKDTVRRIGFRVVRFNPLICLIRCPEDLSQEYEIIKLCHRFQTLGSGNKTWFRASEIVRSRDFAIENDIEDILVRAIQDSSLQMYYQPIYDLHKHKFRSAEALARIVDSEYGMISPAIFIPAAERSGLILPLGNAVLESVYQFIAANDLKSLGIDYIEINLSVEQCRQGNLADTIFALQEKYSISPRQVNFEITESVFDSFEDVVEQNIRKLVEMGYRFSLDDYGTGYSNLQRLRKTPLTMIKIDKSLVDDLFSEEGRIVMRDTIRMMQDLDKEILVEGVETKDSLNLLNEMHCDFIQGFYFSKALPADHFLRFIQSANA